MKRLLFVLLTSFVLLSCNKFESPIKEEIKKNALGMDLKYRSIEIKVIDTITVEESIMEIMSAENTNYSIINSKEYNDSIITKYISGVEKLCKIYKEDEEIYKLKIWNYRLDRIKYLSKKSPKDIELYIVYNKYKIYNPLFQTDIEVERVFIFNSDNVVLCSYSEDDLDISEFKNNYENIINYKSAK